MDNCYFCRKRLKDPPYACCSQTKLYCPDCKHRPCTFCRKYPKIKPLQPIRRPDKQYRLCALCKAYESVSQKQHLHQAKCDFGFCYRCLLPFYQKFRKEVEEVGRQTGIRPELPFELPCRCEIPESQIVAFLQLSCYCCAERIGSSLSYRLNNGARVRGKCLEGNMMVQRRKEIVRMLVRCEGCDKALSEPLPSQQNLNVCQVCFRMNKLVEQIGPKTHKRPKTTIKQQLAPKSPLKKGNQQSVYHDLAYPQKDTANQPANLAAGKAQPQMRFIRQPQNSLRSKLEDKSWVSQQKRKVGQQSKGVCVQGEGAGLLGEVEVLQGRTLDLSRQILQNLAQCSHCNTFMHSAAELYPTQGHSKLGPRHKAQGSPWHKSQGSPQLKSQGSPQLKSQVSLPHQLSKVCRMCLCSLKQALMESLRKSKNNQQALYPSYLKTGKDPRQLQPNQDNKLSKFDQPASKVHERMAELPQDQSGPANQLTGLRANQLGLLTQHCQSCSKIVKFYNFNKKLKKCRDCECKEVERERMKPGKEVEITCKMCRKQKRQKESQLGKFGYCADCHYKAFTLKA